jgi:hypothetical protein
VVLADHVIERLGPHAGGQRRVGGRGQRGARFLGLEELIGHEVHKYALLIRAGLDLRAAVLSDAVVVIVAGVSTAAEAVA